MDMSQCRREIPRCGIEGCVVSLDKVVNCRVHMLLGIRSVPWLVRVVHKVSNAEGVK